MIKTFDMPTGLRQIHVQGVQYRQVYAAAITTQLLKLMETQT